jgi:uncharacterized protein (DUF2147 family)
LRGILSNSTKILGVQVKNSLTTRYIGRTPIALFRRLKTPFRLAKKARKLPAWHRFRFARDWISFRLRKGPDRQPAFAPRGESSMFAKIGMAVAAALIITGAASADPIEGNWKTKDGDTAAISACGGSFCIKLTTGKYAGKSIGTMSTSGTNSYSGSITKPSNGKTYSGSAKLSGSSLKLSGCVLAILCESQTWKKL